MLRLHGFALSNYYNKVKLALLEKGVPFEEVLVPRTGHPVDKTMSPLGKVPYLETEHGSLCESQVILDYIEARWPTPALVPADPWQAAKQREVNTFLELHVELCARQLYPQAFFGEALPDKFTARVKGQLAANLAAFKQLAVFGPYVAGDTFSAADCAAYTHLPLAGLASKIVYGEDLVVAAGIDWKPYVKLIEARPTAQKVAADRKADQGRT
ncbi:MAG: glutathione S-transferase family protein, partial [Rubrivivax sp.]